MMPGLLKPTIAMNASPYNWQALCHTAIRSSTPNITPPSKGLLDSPNKIALETASDLFGQIDWTHSPIESIPETDLISAA